MWLRRPRRDRRRRARRPRVPHSPEPSGDGRQGQPHTAARPRRGSLNQTRGVTMTNEHERRAASFYGSPQEAQQAPAEEFLYLACLHEGTDVEAPDFLAVVDAEDGAIVHE